MHSIFLKNHPLSFMALIHDGCAWQPYEDIFAIWSYNLLTVPSMSSILHVSMVNGDSNILDLFVATNVYICIVQVNPSPHTHSLLEFEDLIHISDHHQSNDHVIQIHCEQWMELVESGNQKPPLSTQVPDPENTTDESLGLKHVSTSSYLICAWKVIKIIIKFTFTSCQHN